MGMHIRLGNPSAIRGEIVRAESTARSLQCYVHMLVDLRVLVGVLALASGLAVSCSGSGRSENSVPAGPGSYCLNTPLYMTNPPGETTCRGMIVTDTPDSGLPDRLAQLAKVCTEGDGLVVTSCPTANLVGCCQALSRPDPGETCFYSGTASSREQSCCAGGQCPLPYDWSTTPF
jgi:hypothetical protein